MRAILKPSKLSGSVTIPPSKSYAHRILICSALANGKSTIRGINKCEDILATIDCIKELGADVKITNETAEIIPNSYIIKELPTFFCRESGSTLRFIIPIALTFTDKALFTGTNRLLERGIGIYESIFQDKKISFTKKDDSILTTGKLTNGDFIVNGDISSQFITGLLISLSRLDGNSTVTVLPPIESKPYIDITIDVLRQFGVNIIEKENTYYIKKQTFLSQNLSVEADWSNSAFFYAANSIGANIEISGLKEDSIQGDKIIIDLIKKLDEDSPRIDLSNCPDLAPVLFSLSALKHGATFIGTKRLKIKESNRAEAMKEELSKYGVIVTIEENSVTINPENIRACEKVINSHNDHRIVMAMSLIANKFGGTIENADAINKSYPDFFKALEKLGQEVSYES